MDDDLQRQLEKLSPAQRELFLKLRGAPGLPTAPTATPTSYPLSFAQQRFWLLEQLHPGEPAHHLSGLLAMTGPLDRDALQRAVDQVVARHATLRTTFAQTAEQPTATPRTAQPFVMPFDDLRELAPVAREAVAKQHIEACTLQPFDLKQAPLLRAHLLQLADERWQLAWCVHHIAADGLSMVRVIADLEQFYGAFVDGTEAREPAPALGYHDFARWTAARADSGAFDAGLAFFADELRAPPTTRLLADHRSGAADARGGRHARGARLQQPVEGEVAAALLQLSHDRGCTPFVTMLTAFVAALHRWIGDDDVVLGTPFANRSHPGLQNAVGLLVNSVVLRCRPTGSTRFLDLLDQVKDVVRTAFTHGDVPFERLVAHLAPERHLDRNPLFQVMFNYVDFADVDTRVGGMQWRYEEAPAGTLFDFTLYVRRHAASFVLEAEYDQSLYTEQTIALRLQELHTLLQAAANDCETELARLPLLPPGELQLLTRWQCGARLSDGPDTTFDVVASGLQSATIRDRDAAVTGPDLLRAIANVQHNLLAQGVRKGDRVAFELPRSRWLPIVALAIWRCGAVAVPVDPGAPAARRQAVLAAAQPTLRIADLDRLLQHEATAAAEPVAITADDPAYLLYTSGSTGQPKGVVVPHGALAAFLRAMQQTLPIAGDDTLLAITSASFDIAWLEWLLPLCAGGTVHIATEECVRDGRALARELSESRATYLQATPSTYRLLLEAGFRGNDGLHLLCGGEALDDELAARLRQRCLRLWNLYGPTETTIWSTVHEVATTAVRIGRPIPGTNVFVVDTAGQRVPIGCAGELWIGGAGLASGYDALPEITRERFVVGPDGARVYRTGDRVRFDHTGALEFLGRIDQQVKVRGHRIEPGAVEAWLAEHDDVAECIVHAVEADDGTELVAHVVAKTGTGGATDMWRHVWDEAYRSDELHDVAFDSPLDVVVDRRGWRDSRSLEPIAIEVMRRFVGHTCERIAALEPRHVLEVGCGTGMLVAGLAARCETWLATDPTAAAVVAVRDLYYSKGLRNVTAQQLAAHELDALEPGSYDCIVINSVAQYFPDLDYLLQVLHDARRLLAPGGTIFLGDVRLLPLHGAFVAWRELAGCSPTTSREEFAARCDAGLTNEPELLIAPTLFDELVAAGAFADRWIAAKAGNDDTEMDRFRADIVLTVDAQFEQATSWPAAGANVRTAASFYAFAMRHDRHIATVADLRTHAAEAARTATAAPHDPSLARRPIATSTGEMPKVTTLRHTTNTPSHGTADLRAELRRHLAQHLPQSIVPSRITVHAQLPRLPSGKVDRGRLRSSIASAPHTTFRAPVTEAEQQLARLFEEVLAQDTVGRDDDFFARGGHSLGAARLVARIRDELATDIGLRQVFATPVVRDLARKITAGAGTGHSELQPRPADTPLVPGATMERLAFLQRLNPGSRQYLMIGVVDVTGPLQLPLFEQALHDVGRRHEVLQLRIEYRRGKAELRRTTAMPPLRDLVDEATFEHTLDTMNGDDLQPLQVLHVALSPDTRRFAFVLHHAFADGWSLAILRRDLANAYSARVAGREPDWPPLPLQYLDFVHWHGHRAAAPDDDEGDGDDARAFWRHELDGAPTVLELPTERPRPPQLRECGERLDVQLDARLTQRAAEFAQQHGTTTFVVFLATFQLWLHRLSGQGDLLVGTSIANRDHRGLEDAMGCFLQTLPLRARIDGDPSFAELVATTHATFLRCTEHQSLPFQELLDVVEPPRLLNRTPLIQATIDWLNHPSTAASLPGVEVIERDRGTRTSKFELSLVVTQTEPFAGYLEYRTDLFATTTVRAWWRSFGELLTQAVATPDAPQQQLSWLHMSDRQRLLQLGTGPTVTWPHGDVVATFAAQIAATPDASALRCGGETLTYRQLGERIADWRTVLREHALAPGDRIAICLPRSLEQLIVMLAILHERCAYVVLDPDQPDARSRNILAQASVRLGVCADASAPPFATAAEWCDVAATKAVTQPTTDAANVRPDDLAYVLFTSGSTGEPKGVAVSHRALRNYAFWARDHYDRPRSAALHTSLGFDLSLTSIWPVLLSGGTVTITPSLQHVRSDAPFELVKLTPSHLAAWRASNPDTRLADRLVLGGEALHLEQLTELRADGVRLWNEYGPTEATVGCACHEITALGDEHGPAAIGTPIANTRLYVLDEARQLVPPGTVGELWIGGASLADGYYGNRDLTAANFVDDPTRPGERMYRTGDFACWNGTGELMYHGRRDEQCKIRGHRVELGEVRATVALHPEVRDVAVLVQRAPSGSDQLVAYVVGPGDDGGEEVRTFLASRLPAYAVPSHVLPIASLPMDHNGKLQRNALPSPWSQTGTKGGDEHTATDATTAALLELTRDLLRVPDLQPHENFFDAGGDSILALQLVARAAELGLDFEIQDVFTHPTVAQLVQAKGNEAYIADERTEGPLLPMQQWFFDQHFERPEQYDQAIWLAVDDRYDDSDVWQAITTLVARHAALRTRFVHKESATVQQVADTGSWQRRVLDVRNHDAVAANRQIGEFIASSDFDPGAGRCFAATFVRRAPKENWLYLRAHHLVVDAISWSVLGHELDSLLTGRQLPPPPATPVTHALHRAQESATRHASEDTSTCIPAPAAGSEAQAGHALLRLPLEDVARLHDERSGGHRVRPFELLVAAAARAVPNADAHRSILVDIEGHGRADGYAPGAARTVAWFTSMQQLRLPLDAAVPTLLRLVKEQARTGTPFVATTPAPLLVNYLGDIYQDGGLRTRALRVIDGDPGQLRHPDNHRTHAFELRAVIHDDQVFATCHGPDQASSERFAAACKTELQALLTACQEAPAEPSSVDFPLATLTAAQARTLLAGRDAVDDLYPLTPTQQGMLFSSLERPDAEVYREQVAVVIAGPLQPAAMAAAFAAVQNRHQLLRGEVHWRGLQEPHWLIPTHRELAFEHTELPCGPAEAATVVRKRLARLRETPFTFGSQPLFRVELATLGPSHHALLVTYHHVVLDGWSMPLLLGELVRCYREACGEPVPALEDAAPFSEQLGFLATQDADAMQAFWRKRLAGFAEPLHLHGDLEHAAATPRYTRSIAGAPIRYGESERTLPATATATLRSRRGTTMSTLVQTAWAVLLARWTGRRDVLFGVTVAGRTPELADVERRVGLFINTLPLRVQVDEGTTGAALLTIVQESMLAMLAQQHTPLPLSQAQTDVAAGTDPFESLLVFENYPLAEAMRDLPEGLQVTHTTAFERTSYALTLVVIPGDELCLRLLYQEDRYSATFAAQLLAMLEQLLGELVQDAPSPVDRLRWLPDSDARRLTELATGPTPHRHDLVLPRVLAAAVSRPEATAIAAWQDGVEHTMSYAELTEHAARVAKDLRHRGVTRDTIVAYHGPRNSRAVATLLGIWWSGAAYLPLDPAWPEQQVHDVVAACKPGAILDGDYEPPPATDSDSPPIDVQPDSLAYAIATSGTTGTPKIVLIEHAALANYVDAAMREFELRQSDRVLQFASFAFDTAAEEIWPTLCAGATLVMRTEEQAASSSAFVRTSAEQRITVWDLPTAFFHQLAARPFPAPDSLRLCILGGQAADRRAVQSFLANCDSVRLLNSYGPSEATIVATWCTLRPDQDYVPIGRPVPGVQAHVLDHDGKATPIGMPGELCLGGAGLARGYLDKAATNTRFVTAPDGTRLFRTGDRARLHSDGQLEFLGRLDRQVKISGVRIEPEAIERLLLEHSRITEACVVVRERDGEAIELGAFVETGSADLSPTDVRHYLRTRLQRAAIPQHITVLPELPRLVSGKVDRDSLTMPCTTVTKAAVSDDPDVLAVQQIFAKLFGHDVATDDDFFELGGSSLLAVQLADAVHERFAVELAIDSMFADPTPDGIANAIRSPTSAQPAVWQQMRADSRLPAGFVVATTAAPETVSHVLLTGATGFFGRHVLRELLTGSNVHVTCIVRATGIATARERIRAALHHTQTSDDGRVTVLCGDVGAPDLGLDEQQLRPLRNGATVVVHAAAAVDFLRPYAQLREANVTGTRNVLQLCARFGWPLHHVSSVGVFADARTGHLTRIDETIDLDDYDQPLGGYAQSKWAAEQLVRDAMHRGLHATIHRPGRLVADTRLGHSSEHDFVTAMLVLCRDLEQVPHLPGTGELRLDVTPVDHAARELVQLALTERSLGNTFHLVHPDPPKIADLLDHLRAAGWTLQEAPWSEFQQTAVQFLRRHREHLASGFLPFLQAAGSLPAGAEPRFGNARTVAVLAEHNEGRHTPQCPAITRELVALWAAQLPD